MAKDADQMTPQAEIAEARRFSLAVVSVVPAGTGAIGVHRQLAQLLPNYSVVAYPPSLEYMPWRMRRLRPSGGVLVHSPPDHAILVSPPRTPLVVTFHNYVLDSGMRPYSTHLQRVHYSTDLRWLTRRALTRAVSVTAVSQATASLVSDELGFHGSIRVIPNSVDCERFTPLPIREDRVPRVLFCGTPSRRKGFHWLPAIARGLVGAAELACATGRRDLPSAMSGINLLGAVPSTEMPSLYRSSDVLLLPSVREGMSLALLEAMATGLPVVGWDIPSNQETLGPHQAPLLAPIGDVDGLVSRLRWLLDNPAAAAAMGRANRDRVVEQHVPQVMAARYADVFAEAEIRPFGFT